MKKGGRIGWEERGGEGRGEREPKSERRSRRRWDFLESDWLPYAKEAKKLHQVEA